MQAVCSDDCCASTVTLHRANCTSYEQHPSVALVMINGWDQQTAGAWIGRAHPEQCPHPLCHHLCTKRSQALSVALNQLHPRPQGAEQLPVLTVPARSHQSLFAQGQAACGCMPSAQQCTPVDRLTSCTQQRHPAGLLGVGVPAQEQRAQPSLHGLDVDQTGMPAVQPGGFAWEARKQCAAIGGSGQAATPWRKHGAWAARVRKTYHPRGAAIPTCSTVMRLCHRTINGMP